MIVRDARVGGFIRVNRSFEAVMGYTACELKEQAALDFVEPSDRGRFQEAIERGTGFLTARHQTKSGDWIEFDWKVKEGVGGTSLFGTRHEAGCSGAQAGSHFDTPATDMHEILREMALIVEDERPGLKCSVLLLDDEGLRVSVGAGPSLPAEYNAAVEGLVIGPDVGSCGTAAYWNERVIVEDIQNDVLWKDLKEQAAKAGVAACWSHPILSRTGDVLGATALYSTEPRAPTQSELDGLTTAARMFALAVERGYAEQALRAREAEQIQREAEIAEQLRQTAKMEALGVLAGGIAHDFNNLLAAVIGNAEIAEESVPVGTEAHEAFLGIIAASKRATTLCSQMLAYAGRGTLTRERLECNRVILDLGELLKATISKKATLDYRLSQNTLFVEADRTQLDQVIMNLITNAAEALEDRPGTIVVASGLHTFDAGELAGFQPAASPTPGTYIWISVSDTGCGMSSETMDKIFDPFFTTKFTGRGLGLAAVSGIVQQHRGGIRIESELGRGTTFTLLFPPADPPMSGLEREDETTTLKVRTTKRVLVVDDEPTVLQTLVRALGRSGFDVVQARNGREAIETYQAEHDSIDCVLLDLSMPDLDGAETYRELLKIRTDARVVLNSGYAEDDVLRRFNGAELAGVLKKPSPIAVIVRTIVAAMN